MSMSLLGDVAFPYNGGMPAPLPSVRFGFVVSPEESLLVSINADFVPRW